MSGTTPSITMNIPSPLIVGNVALSGTISDPTATLAISYRTNGTPVITDGDVFQATILPVGTWQATVPVDHPGVQSTFWYFIAGGAAQKWASVIPQDVAPVPVPDPTPVPVPAPTPVPVPAPTPVPVTKTTYKLVIGVMEIDFSVPSDIAVSLATGS